MNNFERKKRTPLSPTGTPARLMRLFIWILTFMLCRISTSEARAQEIRISLNMEHTTVKEILRGIEKNSDYTFFYNDRAIDTNRRTTIRVTDKPIGYILGEILPECSWQIDNRRIILTPQRTEPQQRPSLLVTGSVRDDYEMPLIGATVKIKNAPGGTVTDLNGSFTLSVGPEDVLEISYIGYQTRSVEVKNHTQWDFVLREDNQRLDEVVVIGYGTQRRGDVTSSVGSVKKEQFLSGAIKDAGQLIQGQVAGLTITNPSGNPTGNTQILLRGNTTILGASANPLILIDGVPGDFNTVAPEDIERIDVLKDGSAAAIYGSRGTNGVILVTTGKAQGEQINRVEYSGYLSSSSIVKRLEMSNAEDYRREIANGTRDAAWDLGATTDWFEQITRTPFSHVHNLSFKGGTTETNYIVNLNYRSLEGIFKKSDRRSFAGRAEINHSMFDEKLRINVGLIGNQTDYTSTADGGSFQTYIYRQSLIHNPTEPIRNDDGSWYQNVGIFEYENPLSQLYETDGRQDLTQTRFNANILFNPLREFTLKALLSYDKKHQYGGYYETKQHPSTLRDGRNGYAAVGATTDMTKLLELTAQYDKHFRNHNVSFLGGYTYQGTDYSNQYERNWDFPSDVYSYNNIGAGNAAKEGLAENYSYRLQTNLISFFGRLSYAFRNRYLFMAALRHEAASQLAGTKNPWGTFPSLSLGWRMTEEDFMQEQTVFNDLKLRAGYGVTGSQPSDSFLGMSLLSYGDYFYSDGTWIRSLQPSQNPNPNLRWEEKRETNIGLDFSILDSRIGGSLDFYNREINGLLYDYTVPSPPNLYTSTRANVGVMTNRGMEILLHLVPVRKKELTWNSILTFSTNENKLKSLSNELYRASSDYFMAGWIQEPIKTESHIVKIGGPVGDFYGYRVIDIGDDGKWIYADKDGNPVPWDEFAHSFEDKQVIGNGLPRFYAGWNNTLRFKEFDFSVTMRGAFAYQIINCARMFYENNNRQDWNKLKSASDPVFGKRPLDPSVPGEFNSYYVEDGDHWKIDNITLGYTLPGGGGLRHIQSLRVYLSGLNMLTLTGYKGTDPEVSRSGLNPGYDNRDQYPNIRSFTLGVNLSF
ncbi:MAG: SusC/RagA family TonB-linked outer membrane protein [Tannerellaceae bacterium]|jgi:TonB-linked SusC/RagA family outer membrane protein|nr:SusC/RagA family TonB-linked outer membrane protein [Tannerellaceae bacterium]